MMYTRIFSRINEGIVIFRSGSELVGRESLYRGRFLLTNGDIPVGVVWLFKISNNFVSFVTFGGLEWD